MNWFLYDNGLRHERVNRFWLKLLNKRLSHAQSHWKYVAGNFRFSFLKVLNLLSANPTKWSNALKQFVGKSRQIVWVRLAILWSSRLKVIEKLLTSQYSFAQSQPQKYQKNVWNLFKVNKNIWNDIIDMVLFSLLLTLNRFQTLF